MVQESQPTKSLEPVDWQGELEALEAMQSETESELRLQGWFSQEDFRKMWGVGVSKGYRTMRQFVDVGKIETQVFLVPNILGHMVPRPRYKWIG